MKPNAFALNATAEPMRPEHRKKKMTWNICKIIESQFNMKEIPDIYLAQE